MKLRCSNAESCQYNDTCKHARVHSETRQCDETCTRVSGGHECEELVMHICPWAAKCTSPYETCNHAKPHIRTDECRDNCPFDYSEQQTCTLVPDKGTDVPKEHTCPHCGKNVHVDRKYQYLRLSVNGTRADGRYTEVILEGDGPRDTSLLDTVVSSHLRNLGLNEALTFKFEVIEQTDAEMDEYQEEIGFAERARQRRMEERNG